MQIRAGDSLKRYWVSDGQEVVLADIMSDWDIGQKVEVDWQGKKFVEFQQISLWHQGNVHDERELQSRRDGRPPFETSRKRSSLMRPCSSSWSLRGCGWEFHPEHHVEEPLEQVSTAPHPCGAVLTWPRFCGGVPLIGISFQWRLWSLWWTRRLIRVGLLNTSTWALHCRWAGDVFVWHTLSNWKSSAESLFTNSLPPSVWICAGIPNFANQSLKMASATVSASLLAIAVTTAYLVKAFVMQRTNFLLLSAVSIGSNRSAWIRRLGCSGIGRGTSGVHLFVDFFLSWHCRQKFWYRSMSCLIFGQK